MKNCNCDWVAALVADNEPGIPPACPVHGRDRQQRFASREEQGTTPSMNKRAAELTSTRPTIDRLQRELLDVRTALLSIRRELADQRITGLSSIDQAHALLDALSSSIAAQAYGHTGE